MLIGTNYAAFSYAPWDSTKIQTDLGYQKEIKSLGISHIRIQIPDYLNANNLAINKQMALDAVAVGFTSVIFGATSVSFNDPANTITKNNWNDFRAFMLTNDGSGVGFIQWCFNNGITACVIGNEMENAHDYRTGTGGIAPTGAITRSGGTATVTTLVDHDYLSGDTITISGCVETEYNGSFVITKTSATTFTYAVPGTPASPATGGSNIRITDMTDLELMGLVLTLATDAKAAVPGMEIGYSIDTNLWDEWITGASKGALDHLYINLYGSNSLSAYRDKLVTWVATYPNEKEMTEFNVHGSYTASVAYGVAYNKQGYDNALFRHLRSQVTIAEALGMEKMYLYTWLDFNSTTGNEFAFKLTNGDDATANNAMKVGTIAGQIRPVVDKLLGKRTTTVAWEQ